MPEPSSWTQKVRERRFGRTPGEINEERKSSATEQGKHLSIENKTKAALTFLTQNGTAVSAHDDKPEPLSFCAMDDSNVRVRDMNVFTLDLASLSVNKETFELASMCEKSVRGRLSSLTTSAPFPRPVVDIVDS